jgi:TPR repeat protein
MAGFPATLTVSRTGACAANSLAALGNDACMNGLGVLYYDGDGVARDRKVARQWYEKAAALGNPQAKQNLKGWGK